MFRKNPLVELELDYLRQNRPHTKRHYFLLGLALLVATIPLFRLITRIDATSVQAMAFVILSVYWFLQWLIMKAAVASANHELPDAMLGSYSNREIISAKLWAVLRHYRGFIVLVSIAALGLSLALMGYFLRMNISDGFGLPEQNLFSYIKIYSRGGFDSFSIFLPHPAQVLIAGIFLFLMNTVNSILTVSVGLRCLRFRQGIILRLFILTVMFGIFSGLFYFRETFRKGSLPFVECSSYSSYGSYDENSYFCQNLERERTFRRVVESLQASTFSFLDGGITVTTTLLCPSGTVYERYYDEELGYERLRATPSLFAREFAIFPFMWRHLAADTLTMLSQLGLSAFLLWRTSLRMGKKKK